MMHIGTFSLLTVAALGVELSRPAPALREGPTNRLRPTLAPPSDERIDVRRSARPDENAPLIDSITPSVLVPGAEMTIHGSGLRNGSSTIEVRVSGVSVTIRRQLGNRITAVLPPRGFACHGHGPVSVTVRLDSRTASFTHPLNTARQVTLQRGERVILSGTRNAPCVELPADTGEYLVSVVNVSADYRKSNPFAVQATAGRAALGAPIRQPSVSLTVASGDTGSRAAFPGGDPLSGTAGALAARRPPRLERVGFGDPVAHLAIAHQNWQLIEQQERRHSGYRLGRRPTRSNPSQGRHQHTVGDTIALRFSMDETCTDSSEIQGRIAYEGQYATIVEDLSAPLSATMDSVYAELGTEFDHVGFGLIRANFGDPLQMDAQLDGDRKIMMLFTPAVRQFPNVRAFVSSCDFFPQADLRGSNQAEVLYAVPPEHPDSVAGWMRGMRATVIHEVTHIVTFASRFAKGSPRVEASWLSEALAMEAEELYARQFSGAQWRGNTDFETAVRCDVEVTDPVCRTWPTGIKFHFSFLRDYYYSPAEASPLRDSRDRESDDFSFYGSGWSLLRWVLDHYAGSDEASFLARLSTEPMRTGSDNLANAAGTTFESIVIDWIAALLTDDMPDFLPAEPQMRLPSWNLRQIFRLLNEQNRDEFPAEFPLEIRHLLRNDHAETVPGVRGASAVNFRFTSATDATNVIGVAGEPRRAPDADLRLMVIRVR